MLRILGSGNVRPRWPSDDKSHRTRERETNAQSQACGVRGQDEYTSCTKNRCMRCSNKFAKLEHRLGYPRAQHRDYSSPSNRRIYAWNTAVFTISRRLPGITFRCLENSKEKWYQRTDRQVSQRSACAGHGAVCSPDMKRPSRFDIFMKTANNMQCNALAEHLWDAVEKGRERRHNCPRAETLRIPFGNRWVTQSHQEKLYDR